MAADFDARNERLAGSEGAPESSRPAPADRRFAPGLRLEALATELCERVAPCPWGAHIGLSPFGSRTSKGGAQINGSARKRPSVPLYTPEERKRRDASPWTIVQGVLAPLQFAAFAISLALIIRYITTGHGYEIATASILIKTVALYTIMITGSIWEKVVFGKWLFARSFFWEDVFSMLVLGLQTAYLGALIFHWATPEQQMVIAMSAYAAYAINATQFILKLRAARLEGASAKRGRAPSFDGFAA